MLSQFVNGITGRHLQGWKLLTVRLSGTGKNFGVQVKFFYTFPKESFK